MLSSHQASTVQTRDHTAADSHDSIQVRGARENNLKGVSLDIPKRRLTVFTGVSGSGKSSLVFDTIAAESRRLIDETYTAFIQAFMPSLSRPDVDALHNLSAAIIVDQERMGANARSTVGTATDAHTMLRIIFSRIAEPHVGSASAFSFNMAEGMCPECEGLGKATDIDLDEVVDRELSLNEGAIKAPGYASGTAGPGRSWPAPACSTPAVKLKDFTEQQWADLLHKPATSSSTATTTSPTRACSSGSGAASWARTGSRCSRPRGRSPTGRSSWPLPRLRRHPPLNEAARSARIGGLNIADCSAMQVNDLADFIRGIGDPRIGPVLEGLRSTLDSLVEIGLGYLSLNRESSTLSGRRGAAV
ncbi:hypothetical protein GCM10020220_111590 [Nonomuraea rubra]